tara:strand:+ start:143 stop:316 length:174 start_codon:yes stop_codon:yes gene_type:complete
LIRKVFLNFFSLTIIPYGGSALETIDKVTFVSKEKQLTEGVGRFAVLKSVLPKTSFK